jgi:hypothetical protein
MGLDMLFLDPESCEVPFPGKFHMLDGDRIATLLAGYLQELLKEAGLADKIRYIYTCPFLTFCLGWGGGVPGRILKNKNF